MPAHGRHGCAAPGSSLRHAIRRTRRDPCRAAFSRAPGSAGPHGDRADPLRPPSAPARNPPALSPPARCRPARPTAATGPYPGTGARRQRAILRSAASASPCRMVAPAPPSARIGTVMPAYSTGSFRAGKRFWRPRARRRRQGRNRRHRVAHANGAQSGSPALHSRRPSVFGRLCRNRPATICVNGPAGEERSAHEAPASVHPRNATRCCTGASSPLRSFRCVSGSAHRSRCRPGHGSHASPPRG